MREPGLRQRLVEARDVARDLRADVRVQADRGEPLELAVERQHLVRDGQVRLGELLEHDLLDPLLVRRVEVRVKQADGDRLDACGLQLADPLAHLVVVERDEHVAVRDGDALLHGQAVAALDERARLPGQLLLEREVVRLLVPRDVEDVAHPVRRDQPDLRARVREHDVGRDGRAVEEVVDLGERDAGLAAEIVDALDRPARRVVRRGRDLVDGDPTRLLVDEDQVGERAADVDADALHRLDPGRGQRSDDLAPDPLHLVELAVQVGAGDLVDPERLELSDLRQALLDRPAIAKSSTRSPVR